MGEREKKTVGRALRRGVALGLVLVGGWGLSLTADLGGLGERLSQLGQEPALAVALLESRLGALPGQEALTGWGRLLVDSSPLLSAGEDQVRALRLSRTEEENQSGEGDLMEQDGEDEEQPQLTPSGQGEGIVEMTGKGKEGSKYLREGEVYVYNRTSFDLDASVLREGTVDVNLGEGPQILIVHSHGSEAYSQNDGDAYEESDPYRTTDCTHNVVKVGEEMATVFRAHGFQVIHDTTLFDYPSYNEAYDRSKAAVEQWLEKYPTIQVVLDVHRDALEGSNGEIYKMVSTEAGEKVAQVMLVIGSSGGGADFPRWKDNLAFAVFLQRSLVRGYTSLARPIVLRNSRYNQQLLPGSILVEVGGHGNTLTEAIAGARLWADNVARTLLTLKEEG
ncbi:stage II sporulation protein P [Lawsonibacter sp. LCP25S3_G6]|uniref:stage II sporulation protein P n=1 Tax=unclassified Lawsonibacter TaxID=2617946 RepID=UPI003F961665